MVTKHEISNMEQELKPYHFLRIHRSFIINQKKITAFTANDIEIGKQELPIGTNYKEYVFQALKSNTL
ncbi:LytTR family DNA-binding domain-containing protein [Chryseobacterium arthrosphaerae]|nr:LytTR family DNA-binding domain-containing protein [Chryseobacterium arthrosphaerae]WET00414.1 LytTR family DNA-binding domain-containing protein [Chryseobacterium arthrosphaerae]